jgi:hypothetical protein
MMRSCSSLVAIALLTAVAVTPPPARAAGTSPAPVASPTAPAAPAAPELTKLLLAFLDGAGRNDAAMHDRFWADDLIYTGSSGRRIGKADILADVRSAPAPKPEDPRTVYGAKDIRIQQYGDAALVAFRLTATTVSTAPGDSVHVAKYLNSGFFIRRKGEWRAVGWQATKAN